MPRADTVGSLLATTPAALLALLAPKCPMCLAAYLAFVGAGTAAAVAPLLLPAAIVLAVAAIAWRLSR